MHTLCWFLKVVLIAIWTAIFFTYQKYFMTAIFAQGTPLYGCLYSVEWNGGMEWWNGIVEWWNSGMVEWWNGGIVERPRPKAMLV